MQTRQGSTLKSLRSVQTFLDENAAALAGSIGAGARQRLDDIVVSLDGHADVQSGSVLEAQSATRDHQALRTALLRDHMAPIAKIAAAELPGSPGVEPLRMPKGRPSAERLKALAVGMATATVPYTSVFTAFGLPDDFAAQLTAAANTMLQSARDRIKSIQAQAAATNQFRLALSSGRKIVHVLDTMVKRALTGNPGLLVAWNNAKRVQLLTGDHSAPASPTPPALLSAPAPAALPAPAADPTPTPTPAAA